ncbi:unnamed protein product [Callosobruchus maculatus]|uniref:Uncharacterized protein n=1 Tax=Callosobruchus maculatus TaxID=64391 RepID=A0A653BJN0_CALMS|nr:unnamed protein product [Callosobruchus maculatus]
MRQESKQQRMISSFKCQQKFGNLKNSIIMTVSLNLGIWDPKEIKQIKIDDIDLDTKVVDFKTKAQNLINKDISTLDLVYCGQKLQNNKSLSSYGVKPDATIHIFQKIKEKDPVTDKKSDPGFVTSFRTLTLLAGYRNALQRFSRKDTLDKLIESTPGLLEDPGAIAIIQDPELLVHLLDVDNVSEIVTEHPVLMHAANNMLKIVQEEVSDPNQTRAGTSTGYSYSLDALSDDDDDMDSNSDTNMGAMQLSRNASFNAITAAQLAAAIANATNTQFNTNSAGIPTASSSSGTAGGGGIITSEMFSNAIQQAFAFGASASNSFTQNSPQARPEEESVEALTRKWQAQLQQMREMGLVNEVINIRALKATNGDVNAAIEFVLGMLSDAN